MRALLSCTAPPLQTSLSKVGEEAEMLAFRLELLREAL
jgi:hypothetical protein